MGRDHAPTRAHAFLFPSTEPEEALTNQWFMLLEFGSEFVAVRDCGGILSHFRITVKQKVQEKTLSD